MGNPIRRYLGGKRAHLTAGLVAVGALAVVCACALWRSAAPTTPQSVLVIAGCELAIVGLLIATPRGARSRTDLATFISGCLAEAVFGVAFAVAAVIVVFGQSKPSERLGYFVTALVVVPASVALSRRRLGSGETEADRGGHSDQIVLLGLTVVAIIAARVSGAGHVSLRLVVLLLIARTLAALAPRVDVTASLARFWAPPFVIAPVFLAAGALAFVPSGAMSVGRVAAALIVAFAIGAGWAIMRRRPASRFARGAVDAVVLIIAALVVFQLALPDIITALNGNYFLGPATDIRHGHPMLVDTYSQYGVGMFDALAGVFSILPLGYGVLTLVLSTLTASLWAGIYGVLRMGARSQLIAILALAVGVPFYVFGSVGLFTDYPSTGVLRFGLPWLVIMLSVASGRHGADRYRSLLNAAVFAVVAIAAAWSGEAGVYCLGTAAAIACMDAASMAGPLAQRARTSALSVLRLVGAYVAGLVLFTVITRLAAGQWPDWGPYVDFIRLYTTGGLGAESISFWSPGLAIGGVYAASAAVLLGILSARPALVREQLPSFLSAAGLTALGALVFTYFLGRSDPNNLIHISPPLVALVFVWLGIAKASVDLRWAAAVAIASVTFVSAILIAAERPNIETRFGYTALGMLVKHPDEVRARVGILEDNPVVSPEAVAIAQFVASLHLGPRSITVLANPAYATEALFRLGRANAVGTSNPCQEQLSTTGGRRVLSDVRQLHPGGVMVTADRPTYGPLVPLQSYARSLITVKFQLQRFDRPDAGLVAYSLVRVRTTWHGGESVPQPGVHLGAPGCG